MFKAILCPSKAVHKSLPSNVSYFLDTLEEEPLQCEKCGSIIDLYKWIIHQGTIPLPQDILRIVREGIHDSEILEHLKTKQPHLLEDTAFFNELFDAWKNR